MSALPSRQPTPGERARALDMLDACDALVREARLVAHHAPPIPKARARRGKGGVWYTPGRSAAAQQLLTFTMRQLGHLAANVAIACIFYLPDRQIRDGDNLLKLVTDAGTTAGVWRDDSQITGWACQLELDRERPRTIIAVAPHVSTLKRHLTVA